LYALPFPVCYAYPILGLHPTANSLPPNFKDAKFSQHQIDSAGIL